VANHSTVSEVWLVFFKVHTGAATLSYLEIPLYFQQALAGNKAARQFFEGLALSYQRNFVSWVDAAQRPETRQKRLAEALDLLEHKQKLGMK